MSDADINVRRGGPADAQALRALRLEALADTPEAYGSTYEESVRWSDERWSAAASEWNFFLGEHDGAVRGMASGGRHDEHPGTFWLFAMYVSPASRGSGLAGRLVDAVAQWAIDEGGDALYLHVTSSVARARAFYTKVGFRLTGEEITMARDPSLHLVSMVKQLV